METANPANRNGRKLTTGIVIGSIVEKKRLLNQCVIKILSRIYDGLAESSEPL